VVCCGDKFEVAQDRAMVSRGELNYELYMDAYFNMTDLATAVGLSILTPEIFMAQRVGAAAKTSTTVFKSFTKSNFRHNLGQLTGNIPANSQAHHVFPQKFVNQFSKAGINIHDPKFGAWWNTSGHLKNASSYIQAWTQFFKTNPTQSQILIKGRQLMQQYGIPVNF